MLKTITEFRTELASRESEFNVHCEVERANARSAVWWQSCSTLNALEWFRSAEEHYKEVEFDFKRASAMRQRADSAHGEYKKYCLEKARLFGGVFIPPNAGYYYVSPYK